MRCALHAFRRGCCLGSWALVSFPTPCKACLSFLCLSIFIAPGLLFIFLPPYHTVFVPCVLAVEPPERHQVVVPHWSISALGVPLVHCCSGTHAVPREEAGADIPFLFVSVLVATAMGTRTARTIAPPSLTAPSWTRIRMGWVTSVTRTMIMMAFLTSCPQALTTAGWSPTQGRKMIMVRWAFRSHFGT